MKPRLQSRAPSVRGERGFSLIELMIGMAIGLLCTLVIATVLSVAEGQRRGTSSGSDAQIAGSMALYAVQREVAMAGYGFASEPNAVGCPLQAFFNNAAVTVLPPVLAPVIITQGADGAPDQLRVVASSKYVTGSGTPNQVGFSLPTRTIPLQYDPLSANLPQRTQFNVWSTQGMRAGDLMVAVVNADQPCGMFEITATPNTAKLLARPDNARWNRNGFPAVAMQDRCADLADGCAPLNLSGSMLVNMGTVIDVIFTVNAQSQLTANRLDTATVTRGTTVLQGNVVMLKALYGRDTNNDGAVDTYDYTTPTTSAAWAQVLAVRLVIVARSAQYERDEVTSGVSLDVGRAATVAGAVTCGESRCLPIPLTALSDWKHYRYKVFDTIVPLRNQRWRS